MGSDFDGDPSRPQGTKRLHHPSFGCRDLPLAEDLTLVTQHAITTGLVSQIHPDRHAFLCAFVLHCGLLTLLRAATFLHGRSPLHRKWRNREHIASRGRRPSHSISYKAVFKPHFPTSSQEVGLPSIDRPNRIAPLPLSRPAPVPIATGEL